MNLTYELYTLEGVICDLVESCGKTIFPSCYLTYKIQI